MSTGIMATEGRLLMRWTSPTISIVNVSSWLKLAVWTGSKARPVYLQLRASE